MSFFWKKSTQQDFQSWKKHWGSPWNIPQFFFLKIFSKQFSFAASGPAGYLLEQWIPPKCGISSKVTSQHQHPRHPPPSHFIIPPAPKSAKSLRLYGESFSWNSNSCLWIYVFLHLGCLCARSMVRLRYLGTNGQGSRTSSKCCGWEQLGTSATRLLWDFFIGQIGRRYPTII